ncbi:hypothetical protein SNE40_002726 [Patella caerulea]|uniref:Tetraspanin n=1 Tax=Patella caerulea TaxID=87958 RepID=A0AAN8QEH8_PATCE
MAGCAGNTARFLLILFNIIFLISGIAILGVGIWLRVDPRVLQMQDLISLDSENPNLEIAAYILIGFGGIVLLVSVFGFCGGIQESRCLLGLFIACLVIIFIGEISAGVVAAVYKTEIEDKIETSLLEVLKNDYQIGRTKYTQPFDYVQVWSECCGVKNYTDYRTVTFEANQTVPKSCCRLKNKDPDDPQPVNNKECQREARTNAPADYLHSVGCIEGITNKINEYDAVLIGVAIGLACIQIFGVILACCICKNIKGTEL